MGPGAPHNKLSRGLEVQESIHNVSSTVQTSVRLLGTVLMIIVYFISPSFFCCVELLDDLDEQNTTAVSQ